MIGSLTAGHLAIVGTGRLGEALLAAWLRTGVVDPDDVRCTVRRDDHAQRLRDAYPVTVTTDNREAVVGAGVVVLGLKPQVLPNELDAIGEAIPPTATVVSLAAGTRTATIEQRLAAGTPVVRVMTNTPVLVGEAMSVIAPGAHAGEEHLAVAERLLTPVGRVATVAEELLDAVTAVSGSGPAYVFLLAEAMVDAAVAVGLPRELAHRLVVQTVAGAAAMLRDDGREPAALREMVTSPGGTTMAALERLEDAGVRDALRRAITAARDRGAQLAGATDETAPRTP